jgi:NitT/TauT family transport system permease protein
MEARTTNPAQELTGGPGRPARATRWPARVAKAAVPLGALALVLVAWELLCRAGVFEPIVLPAPTAVAEALWEELGSEHFLPNLTTTLIETFAGAAIGILVGFLAGVLVAISPLGRSLLQPVMITLQAVPALVLAPLMLIWFGYGVTSKIALVVLSTFFPLFVTTVQGIRSTPAAYLSLMRALQSPRWRTLLTVRIPFAAPMIFAGVKAAIPSAFSAAVVAEFVGATKGLGLQVLAYNESLQIPHVFALVVVMVVIGVLLFHLSELLDRKLVFWRGRA